MISSVCHRRNAARCSNPNRNDATNKRFQKEDKRKKEKKTFMYNSFFQGTLEHYANFTTTPLLCWVAISKHIHSYIRKSNKKLRISQAGIIAALKLKRHHKGVHGCEYMKRTVRKHIISILSKTKPSYCLCRLNVKLSCCVHAYKRL